MRLLLRLLGLVFVVYAVRSVVKTLVGIVAPRRPIQPGPAAGRLVKDPSCGTYIPEETALRADRKSTRLNSSHGYISYAVFCLKKKKKKLNTTFLIIKNNFKYQ